MEAAKYPCRISYRYRPSGEHKLRCVPLRPVAASSDGSLVNSGEVQGNKCQRAKSGLRSGFGRLPRKTVFGKLAKERVRDACAILDKTYGKRCLFATGTLPGSTPAAFEALASYSGYLIQRLKQWLRDNFHGVKTVWVWELQKRGALHLHCVFGHRSKSVLEKLSKKFHHIWCEYLKQISDKSGIDLFEDAHGYSYQNNLSAVRTDIQFVEKSVGRYLSKYVSKGSGNADKSCEHCPSRWWGIDDWLRTRAVIETVVKVFPVQSYCEAMDLFAKLCAGFQQMSEVHYEWRNRFDPFQHTAVFYLSTG